MSEPSVQSRTCRFPGCERPAAPGEEGVGRPPEYCDDPARNRGAAWGARRAAAAVTAERAVPDDLDRPVSMARARAGEYAQRVAAQIETLTATLATVVTELRTLGDPDAAAVQIEAVTAEIDKAANDFLTTSPDKSPGLWLAVWDPAKGYYEQAYGDAVADTTTATVADHSWIGSITKTVFATAVQACGVTRWPGLPGGRSPGPAAREGGTARAGWLAACRA